jgi:hypothetical protein
MLVARGIGFGPRTVTAAAKQERRPACAALPRINSKEAPYSPLHESVAVDAHRNSAFAHGTYDFVRRVHGWLPLSVTLNAAP